MGVVSFEVFRQTVVILTLRQGDHVMRGNVRPSL